MSGASMIRCGFDGGTPRGRQFNAEQPRRLVLGNFAGDAEGFPRQPPVFLSETLGPAGLENAARLVLFRFH